MCTKHLALKPKGVYPLDQMQSKGRPNFDRNMSECEKVTSKSQVNASKSRSNVVKCRTNARKYRTKVNPCEKNTQNEIEFRSKRYEKRL